MLSQAPSKIPAAQYVRMSTEHQQFSTQHQIDMIQEYAQSQGLEIVKTYADEGKSGLSIGGRSGLKALIADVQGGNIDFKVILVYDVSRWGRFQDSDESAYYEYICKSNGIKVAYVAEQFDNDGSPVSAIIKGIKRAMAGEYSRELSVKVFAGHTRLIQMGFRQGGVAGYGLRRHLIDQNGEFKQVLEYGDYKNLVTDRVILVPGPAHEIELVRNIFDWFIHEKLNFTQIAQRLNEQGHPSEMNREWNASMITRLLKNEKYIGNNVYNKYSYKLKKLRLRNPPERWIRKDAAFEGIVLVEVFEKAQEILRDKAYRLDEEHMLAALKELLRKYGYLSRCLIEKSKDIASVQTYIRRFGSLGAAFALISYRDEITHRDALIKQKIDDHKESFISSVVVYFEKSGGVVERMCPHAVLHINEEIMLSLVMARHQINASGQPWWVINFERKTYMPDVTLAVLLDESNEAFEDYYLLPSVGFSIKEIRIGQFTKSKYECFRISDLSKLSELAQRRPIAWAN